MTNITQLNPKKSKDQIASEIIDFLNEKAGKRFKPVRVNLDFILARLNEGYTEDDLRMVVMFMVRQWGQDDKMRSYLRPATLFNREKFSQYVGELDG